MTPKACLIAVLAAALSAGCLNSHNRVPVPGPDELPAGMETKADLYAAFGAPSSVAYDATGQLLTWDFRDGRGQGLGLLGFAPGLFGIRHMEQRVSRLVIRVDDEGRIVDGFDLRADPDFERRLWPFD